MGTNTNVSNFPIVSTTEVKTAGRLDRLVQKMNLSPIQREDVVFLVTEYCSNVPTIKRMLDWGLTLHQMQELFEVRDRLGDHTDNVSLRILYRFAEEFSLELKSEMLVDQIQEIKEAYDPNGQLYLGQILARVIRTKVPGLIRDPLLTVEFLLAQEGESDES